MKIRLGEQIFRSVQGEGNRAGVLSIWIRFAGCNLRCPGFLQDNPTDKRTFKDPLEGLSPKAFTELKSIPVLKYGCDSLYAIDPQFKQLWTKYDSAKEVVKDITPLLYDGNWKHPLTNNSIDLCFTGGEPLLNQEAMVDVMYECNVSDRVRDAKANAPYTIQIETNGTKKIEPYFRDYYAHNSFELNWNVSPKLYSVSGEKDAVDYNNINEYFNLSAVGSLKFVVNDSDECWKELDDHVKVLRDLNVPIYVMPVGATFEQQTNHKVLGNIASKAIERGYHVSGRLHAILWENVIGV